MVIAAIEVGKQHLVIGEKPHVFGKPVREYSGEIVTCHEYIGSQEKLIRYFRPLSPVMEHFLPKIVIEVCTWPGNKTEDHIRM